MLVNEINPERSYLPLVDQLNNQASKKTTEGSFADTFNELLKDVDSLQKESGNLTDRFIKGEDVDLHDVMIAAEKSKTAFQLLVEMRNKFLDLYREVSRIQV